MFFRRPLCSFMIFPFHVSILLTFFCSPTLVNEYTQVNASYGYCSWRPCYRRNMKLLMNILRNAYPLFVCILSQLTIKTCIIIITLYLLLVPTIQHIVGLLQNMIKKCCYTWTVADLIVASSFCQVLSCCFTCEVVALHVIC